MGPVTVEIVFCETEPLEGAGPKRSLSFWAQLLGRDETGDGQTVWPKTKDGTKRKIRD